MAGSIYKSCPVPSRYVAKVSCPRMACNWTTGRKISHSNSIQLTAKWGVGCYIVFMATDDVTERVVYISDVGWCVVSVQKQTTADQRSQNAYIT